VGAAVVGGEAGAYGDGAVGPELDEGAEPTGAVIPGGSAWARAGSARRATARAAARSIAPTCYKARAACKCAPARAATTDF
jgi:hypothetical protein